MSYSKKFISAAIKINQKHISEIIIYKKLEDWKLHKINWLYWDEGEMQKQTRLHHIFNGMKSSHF